MNRRLRTLGCTAGALLLVVACGGKRTMASKSAAAYREAQAKDIAVAGGHDMQGMQHGSTEHAGMQHGTMQHGEMQHAEMQHGQMQHGSMEHGTMQHGAMPSSGVHAGHQQMTGTSPHAGHAGMPAGPPPNMNLGAPTSNAEIARTQPAATLQQDDFDAPAPSAVSEAQKAAGGSGGHGEHGATTAPADPHAGHGQAAGGAKQTIYTCPMHAQVTSNQPGTCPICGMTLVKKEQE